MKRLPPNWVSVKAARNILFAAQDPIRRRLLPPGEPEWSERLLAAVGLLPPWLVGLFRSPAYQRFADFLIRHTNPGLLLHLCLRKRLVYDECRTALARGTKQVLSLGSGLDPLSVRLSLEHPEVLFVDNDFPGTMECKRTAVERLAINSSNLCFVGADLARARVGEMIRELPRWRTEAKTLVIAEAVLPYLPPAAVATVIDDIYHVTGAGSEFLLTYVQTDSKGQVMMARPRLMPFLMRMYRVPLRWIPTAHETESFFRRHGFELEADGGRFDPAMRYLEPAGLARLRYPQFEFFAVARRMALRRDEEIRQRHTPAALKPAAIG